MNLDSYDRRRTRQRSCLDSGKANKGRLLGHTEGTCYQHCFENARSRERGEPYYVSMVGVYCICREGWEVMKQAVKQWYLPFIAASIIMGMFGTVWTWVIHEYFPAVKSNIVNTIIPDTVFPGETVRLCRHLEITRPVDLSITRALVRTEPDGAQFVIDMGSTEVSRQRRTFMQCRWMLIPDKIPSGEWTLRVNVAYTDFPFWKKTLEMPPIKLTVL